MSTVIKSNRLRRTLATLGISAALVGGVAGAAEAAQGGATAQAANHHTYSTVAHLAKAAQGGDLGPNQTATYSTWFFGRTHVSIQNTSPEGDAFLWSSSTSHGGFWVAPGTTYTLIRSFVGFPITITNIGPETLHVSFPGGP
jgi:hypothetical protein